MPKLFIPALGTELKLLKDWHFKLFEEKRNQTLIDFLALDGALGPQAPACGAAGRGVDFVRDARLPAGVTLQVDRIYIRKNQEDFDSITFLLKGAKSPAKTVTRTAIAIGYGPWEAREHSYEKKIPSRGVRFWVKLDEANNIYFE